MKSLWPWLFNGLAALSAVLCVMVALVWAARLGRHSRIIELPYRCGWMWAIEPRGGTGELMVEFWHFWGTPIVGPVTGPGFTNSPADLAWMKQFGARVAFERRGFEVGRMPAIGTNTSSRLVMEGYTRWIRIPDWLAILALAILPVIAWRRRRSRVPRDRAIQGLCVVCGYDLRATPDRCPECGAIPD